MNIKRLVKKIIFRIPGVQEAMQRKRKTMGTGSARYCYAVWLRYLVMIRKNGLPFPIESVVELGPGNSLGVGLAAMLSGVNKYFAFDIIKHANTDTNCKVFDELIELYKRRGNIPDAVEFPDVKPYLESYEFPAHILTNEHLGKTLKQDRVESIRKELCNLGSASGNSIQLRYFVPWNGRPNLIKEESIDMIYSQTVMQYVDDLEVAYKTLHNWLKPNGFMLHQIDFKNDNIVKEWNGHWKYSDSKWRAIIRRNESYLLNREPYSKHVYYMQKNGFKIVFEKKVKSASGNKIGIQRSELSPRFKDMSDDDFTTSGVFVLAIKLV